MANNSNRKAIEFMVQGALPPHSTNVLWMDTSVPELPVLKIFENGAWTNVHTEDSKSIELLAETVLAQQKEIAQLTNAIETKIDRLQSTVAKEYTSQEIKELVLREVVENIANMREACDNFSQAAEAYNTGKVELAENITAKGVPASASETLPELAGKVQAIQNINKEFNVSDISQRWLGMPGTLELIAQYYDTQYPYAQAYILEQGASVTAITGCKRIVYSDGGSVVSIDNPSGAYTIGAYSDEVTIGFAVLMFDTPVMQNVPVSNNAQVFEFGCKDATINFSGMNNASVCMCRFDGCDITLLDSALAQSQICIFDIGNSDITISDNYTFYKCSQLQIVSLPNLVTISSNSTFDSCSQLQSVSLPNLVTIGGTYTFASCYQLQNVSLPNLVTISGTGTFASCIRLQSVSLPNLVTISGAHTFYNCTQLQNVSLPNLVTISGVHTFASCTRLQSISLPNLVTISGDYMFFKCTQLQNVSLPNLVTISGAATFVSCTQLQSVSLPNLVTISGSRTFESCPNLIDIELGAAIDASFTLSTWSPKNVLEDNAKKAQMLQNIREHIAANLPDRTGLSSLTATFSADVKAAILADTATMTAFTNKNWTIA